MRVFVAIVALALPLPGAAQSSPPESAEQPELPSESSDLRVGPEVGSWALQLSGAFFLESWDLNAFRERLAGGSVSAFRQLTPRWAIGVETNLLHVRQNPLEDVILPALSLMARWTAFQHGKTTVFIEGGGGSSYASGVVPNEGTRFNLVTHTGIGLSRSVTPRIDLIGGARWLHVSNNGLDGRRRNPDIQALGLYVGWSVH